MLLLKKDSARDENREAEQTALRYAEYAANDIHQQRASTSANIIDNNGLLTAERINT
jgi:hypothetical protein